MKYRPLVFSVFLIFLFFSSPAQVKVRIFSDATPGSVLFTVVSGEYQVDAYSGKNADIRSGSMLFITGSGNKLAVKVMNEKVFVCDSVRLRGKTGNDRFTLRMNDSTSLRQTYSGDLKCLADLGTMVFINICDIESYIAGVVRSEGGPGRHAEYLKTQAIIARTYMFRYMDKHVADGFNMCDNTHCQTFQGITDDPMIAEASSATTGQVIVGQDSALIIAAFHSNCGGETVPSEDVWLMSQPYLKRIRDPHCLSSRNALWRKSIALNDWTVYLKKSGYSAATIDRALLNFSQSARSVNYKVGTFEFPLTRIRADFGLRSTFFSVTVEGDSVILKGKGYGHGVGLCQEGAMAMAQKGYSFRQIIGFYYPGVRIVDIGDVQAMTRPGL